MAHRAGLWTGAAIALAALSIARDACAQSCPKDAETRVALIRDVMRSQASRARTWTIAWSAIGFGLSAEAWVEYAFVDPDKRLPQALVSIAPLYIPAQLAVFPLRVPGDQDALEKYLTATSTSLGPMASCLRLERAEELFALAADDEAAHASVVQHVLTWVLSGAYTAFLAVAFHDPKYTFVDGAGSVVVGEIQILTQPTGAARALDAYRRGDFAEARRSASVVPTTWWVGPASAGVGLAVGARF